MALLWGPLTEVVRKLQGVWGVLTDGISPAVSQEADCLTVAYSPSMQARCCPAVTLASCPGKLHSLLVYLEHKNVCGHQTMPKPVHIIEIVALLL